MVAVAIATGRTPAELRAPARRERDGRVSSRLLALARLLLQRPRWVFLEDATAAMGEEQRRLMVSIFCRDLAGATVVGIGRGTALGGFYARTVCLHRLRAGALPYHRPRPYLMVQGGKVAQAGAF